MEHTFEMCLCIFFYYLANFSVFRHQKKTRREEQQWRSVVKTDCSLLIEPRQSSSRTRGKMRNTLCWTCWTRVGRYGNNVKECLEMSTWRVLYNPRSFSHKLSHSIVCCVSLSSRQRPAWLWNELVAPRSQNKQWKTSFVVLLIFSIIDQSKLIWDNYSWVVENPQTINQTSELRSCSGTSFDNDR